MDRVLRLVSASVVTVFLCNFAAAYDPAYNICSTPDQRHQYAGDHLGDSNARHILATHSTAISGFLLGAVVVWVLARVKALVSPTRKKHSAGFARDDAHGVCVAVGLLPLLTRTSSICRTQWTRMEDSLMDALYQVSGHFGVFVAIAYSLDPPMNSACASGSQPIARSSLNSLANSSSVADIIMRIARQSDHGSNALWGLFSVYDLVSAYQFAYYRVSAPLDPDAFDMDAYLATPIKLYALLGSSDSVDSTWSANISLDRLTIHDILSAYYYAVYPVPLLLSVALNLNVDDGLELTDAALMFYYPELLPSLAEPQRVFTTILHWLDICTLGTDDVSEARIEELDDDQDQLMVVYGPERPPAPAPTTPRSTIFVTATHLLFTASLFSTQDLHAAFAYAYHAIPRRAAHARFACHTLRVVHRTRAADFNVHVFNARTRARLLTLVEDPPEAFRCRPASAFARVESFASTTTEGSSSSSDSDFPYTDDSDVDFENGLARNVVNLDLDLTHGPLDLDLDLDSDAEKDADWDWDWDSEGLDEMTWMLEELTVDDYPALYDWELEALVRALEALAIDDLLCLRDGELCDLLALLRAVNSDISCFGCDSGLGAGYLVDVERKLEAARARLSDGHEEGLYPSPSLGSALVQLLEDGEALEASMPPASDKHRVLRELLARLRSRRHDDDTDDLLPAAPRKDKGKGKARALDDEDFDGPLSGLGDRTLGHPRSRRPRHGQPNAGNDNITDSDSDDDDDKLPTPSVQKRKKRHRGGKRIPMAERRRRNRRTVQETLAPLRDVEFVEGPSWCPDDERWCEGFGMW